MSRLAEEAITARAHEARMQAIGRHFAQIRELTAQKYLVESALSAYVVVLRGGAP